MRMTQHHGDSRKLCNQALEYLVAGVEKIIPQQQIFRRITGQSQFSGQQQAGTRRFCATRGIADFCGIAVEVANRDIQLCNRYFHGANISSTRISFDATPP